MSELSLPVVNTTTIRPSKSGRRRAVVLIVVQILIAIHIALWIATGETMTPLEPSEAMEFSKHSIVNAGLIFFALTILSTLIFGRWFCGWACHLVALQDGCRWMLGKLKLRPRAVQLGILGTVPLVAFIYMFIAPLVYRMYFGDALALRGVQLTTDAFWVTFPSWIPALLTLGTCGFIIVYLLGSKGFCTYGCPYGAIFGVVDQLAVGSIRVTDACRGCGHCTAVCSSNVRVHQEVRDFGMVVDPGCMKCLDCVSVCPNDALYFGVGRPSMFARRRAGRRASHVWAALPEWLLTAVFLFAAYSLFMWYDEDLVWRISGILTAGSLVIVALFKGRAERTREFSLAEQVVLAGVFLASMYAFRGIYGLVPYLFALGLGAILSFGALHALRLAYRRDVGLHGFSLKRAGRIRPAGIAFAAGTLAIATLAVHSGLVQHHTLAGRRTYQAAAIARGHGDLNASLVEAGLSHLSRGYALSLVKSPYDLATIGRFHFLAGDLDQYERLLGQAIAARPGDAELHKELGDLLGTQGRPDEALASYRHALDIDPDRVELSVEVGRYSALLGRYDEAREVFEAALVRDPSAAIVVFNYGVLESMLGRDDEALARFERAVALDPDFVAARENLAGLYCQVGRFREGIAQFNEAIRIRPDDTQTHELIARAYLAVQQWPQAETHLRRVLELAPGHGPARALLAELDAFRSTGTDVSVEEEVARNILAQAVGSSTLQSFALPEPFLRRVADRVIRETYRARHRQVLGEGAGDPSPAGAPGRAGIGLAIRRHEIPDAVVMARRLYIEDRPALRGFRAPINPVSGLSVPWPQDAPAGLRTPARLVAELLAVEGLLPTVARVIESIGPDEVLADVDGVFDTLRDVGVPVDLLAFFEMPDDAVAAIAQRLRDGVSAEVLAAELRETVFDFRPTRPGFRLAAEDGNDEIGMLRLQLTRGTYWRGPGAGGCLDVARQLVETMPDVNIVASIEQRHLQSLTATVSTWPLDRRGQFTVLVDPMRVSQWAQDNGKAGIVDGRVATIVPRYASRREDGSVFVPNESFLVDGLAAIGHTVIHSPLLFQGGNLLLVDEPAAGFRTLLVGEAEIYRNTAMGLTVEQVLQAFRVEFGVDRCVALPAVSFHIDYDLSVRVDGDGRVIAFVNDTDAAVRIVLDLGIGALEAHGTLDRETAAGAREHLAAGRMADLVELVRPLLLATADDRGRFPGELARHFANGAMDSPIGNLQRFMAAMDAATSLRAESWPSDRHARSFFASFDRRRADRADLHRGLASLGWLVVPVPSLADAEVSLIAINGIHDRTHYLMPAYGGFYAPLDKAAAEVFRQTLGPGVDVVPIFCGESQRRVGAVHCSAAAYPRVRGPAGGQMSR